MDFYGNNPTVGPMMEFDKLTQGRGRWIAPTADDELLDIFMKVHHRLP